MKTFFSSPLFREFLIFAGILGVALTVSTMMAEPSLATSMIDTSDNVGAVSAATGGEGSLKDLVKTILDYALTFLGFVCVVMVIYGGILYVTSAGNDDNAGKAKKILLYCAIGIILILVSYALVNTILGAGLGGASTSGTTTGTAI
jgi:hypothetical protein